MNDRYLLDTCAIIWFSAAEPLTNEAVVAISLNQAAKGGIALSVMSAWEIGMLVSKKRLKIDKAALDWFEAIAGRLDADVFEATPKTLVAASFLPQPVHNDPVDRILIATAREHDLTIMTRDRAILSYGAAGHVKVLAC